MLKPVFDLTLLILVSWPLSLFAVEVSHWRFDGDAIDSDPAGNNGVILGAASPTFDMGYDGRPAGAIHLDGLNDHVRLTQASHLPAYANLTFTMTLWVKALPVPRTAVFAESSSTNNAPLFYFGTDTTGPSGAAEVTLRDTGGTSLIAHARSTQRVFDNKWHHVAWVEDSGAAALFVDGIKDPTDFTHEFRGIPFDRTALGAISRSSICCFLSGAIDDVRFYDHALTEAEILSLLPMKPSCPSTGDTHCTRLEISGPSGGTAGLYTFEASGTDDSGDQPLYFTFTATRGADPPLQVGPQASPTAKLYLAAGSWTLSVTVDDDLSCFDKTPDQGAVCQTIVTVAQGGDDGLLSNWTFDGHLFDLGPGRNDGRSEGAGKPTFVTGYDGTPNGAISFDGRSQVIIAYGNGLPISGQRTFTLAFWVKGFWFNNDRDLSSILLETSSLSDAPMYRLGTVHGDGLEFFLRDELGVTLADHCPYFLPFDNAWHHVAWVQDRNAITHYVDGRLQLVASPRDLSCGPSYPEAQLPVDTTVFGAGLTGALDDVRLYTRALSQAEVHALLPNPPLCPQFGQSYCTRITVEGPSCNCPGDYSIKATGTDAFFYTFIANTENGLRFQAGPQVLSETDFFLDEGTWTITVKATQNLYCPDEAPNGGSYCTETVHVLPDEPRLVSHWPLDRHLLDVVSDNHGTFVGDAGPIYDTGYDGTVNGALVIKGGTFVDMEENSGLPIANSRAFSVCYWFSASNWPGFGLFYESDSRLDSQINGFSLSVTVDNREVFESIVALFCCYNQGSLGTITSQLHLPLGVWHHVAWVDEFGRVKVYLDGSLDLTNFNYVRPNRGRYQLEKTTLGWPFSIGDGNNRGRLDEVRVYNYALNDDEVRALIPGLAPCPSQGDTHCLDLRVSQNCSGRGVTAEANARDDSVVDIYYTFTAQKGARQVTKGPTLRKTYGDATLLLEPGLWTISVAVDDDLSCSDQAADATRSVEFYVDEFPTSSDCNGNGIPDHCEWQDCNQNGTHDACDIDLGQSHDCNSNKIPDECEDDCNRNGFVDSCDIGNNTSLDCNADKIPDECEPDCNGNHVEDSCDIANRTSQDCDVNGIPDECDPDCNRNGTNDQCEIDQGTTPDCNSNRVPDACDIASGASPDADQNGVPDECQKDVRVVPSLVLTDPAATQDRRDSLPGIITHLRRGTLFWIELWAIDLDRVNTGLTSVYTDVELCRQIKVLGLAHGNVFTVFPGGAVTGGAAFPVRIDEFGGSAVPNGGGIEPEWVRVGWIEARAEVEVTSCGIRLFPSQAGVGAFNRGEIEWSKIGLGAASLSITSPGVSYDLDGNRTVGTGDLARFTPSWQQAVPPAPSAHDFDCDSFAGVGDLSWFATAWLKSVNDPTIQFPPCATGEGAGAGIDTDVSIKLIALSTPSPQDSSSILPESTEVVSLGEEFYLEMWASDVGSINTGLTSAYVDVIYPPGLTAVVSAKSSNTFNVFPSGTVKPGLIDELGGSNLPGGIGIEPGWVRVAIVELRAENPSPNATFSLSASRTGVACLGRGSILWQSIDLNGLTISSGSSSVPFRRGDANADGTPDLSDAVFILNFLFTGGRTPSCQKAADTNDSANIDLSDAVYLLSSLFLGGRAPPDPFQACDLDPTPDTLTCEGFPVCQ